jgi:choline dehydrogenase-like flavoprotein
MPLHDHLLPPLDLDEHSTQLMSRYGVVRERLNSLACHLGRSRVATLSRDMGDRRSCEYLGRCIWGCPIGALYTPSMTIEACQRFNSFEYLEGLYVERFGFDEDRRIRTVTVREVDGGERRDLPVDHLVLAAGALASSRIFLESMRAGLGESPVLTGLMDNRQVLVPFVNVKRLGAEYDADSYQYHQLALGLECDRPEHYVHGQITTLTTAQVHPVLQSIPMDFRTAGWVFRNARAALGLVNLNFHDFRRPDCRLALGPTSGDGEPPLSIAYSPDAGQEAHVSRALKRLKKALRTLGCFVVPGTEHIRPMGASVHYSGTIPISDKPEPLTTSRDGLSRDFQNLTLVDGTTFPFLPAKNLTFTLMANAARIADRAF